MSKLDKMFEVISANHFKELFDLSDDLKCVVCHKMLNNAHQLICGCRFCKKCVDDLLKTEVQFCPGLSFNCGNEMLSNQTIVQVDHRANKEISILIVNCPKQTCTHKCELIFMANHLEICVTCFQRCPFYEFGCEEVSEKMNDHLQLMSANHNQMLIENICILRNEITVLKNSIKINLENELLKDQQIISLNDQIELLKTLVENQNRELFNEKCQLLHEIDEKKMISEELLLIKSLQEINVAETYNHNINNDKTPSFSINNPFIISWKVENIFERRLNGNRIWSPSFYSRKHGYQMRLLLYPNGYGSIVNRGISLYLYIYSNNAIKWPFVAKVFLSLSNSSNKDQIKSIIRNCNMDKPIIFSWFSSFKFNYDQWLTEEHLSSKCITIQCDIDDDIKEIGLA